MNSIFSRELHRRVIARFLWLHREDNAERENSDYIGQIKQNSFLKDEEFCYFEAGNREL